MAEAAPLHLTVAAIPGNVVSLRRSLRRWLVAALDDGDTADDLLLATSEALENVVDHAFAGRPDPGSMILRACHHDEEGSSEVVVVVSDDGRWQPHTQPGYRGRGLQLITELAETHRVHTDDDGTTVTIRQRR